MSAMNMWIFWIRASVTCAMAMSVAGCSPQKPTPTAGAAPAAPATSAGGVAASAAPQSAAASGAPAPVMTSPPTRIVSNDGSYIVLFTTRPDPIPTNDTFTVSAMIYDARRGQTLVTDADVVVDAAMPEHRHGMNVVPRVRKLNNGSYVASGMVFHMPGRWELYFDITRKGETERAQAELVLE